VIAGSSTVSRHAKDVLDEAAVLTDDGATVRRAISVFEELCTEPVRKEYLAKCLKEYRPPKFLANGPAGTSRLRKQPAKVWIIGGLRYGYEIPDSEDASADRAVADAETKLLDFERAEIGAASRYSRRHASSRSRATHARLASGGTCCSASGQPTAWRCDGRSLGRRLRLIFPPRNAQRRERRRSRTTLTPIACSGSGTRVVVSGNGAECRVLSVLRLQR